MRARWEQLKPSYSGSPYAVAPSAVAPYAPGDAAAGFRADGLNMINFARYLSGLPADVRLDASLNAEGQYGSVLLRKLGYLVHTPTADQRPADMTVAFFDTAKSATSTSNIGAGYPDSESFQKGCLDDADVSNIARVGHRRWLLNPSLLYTGIGFVENYHTTKVMGFTAAQKRTEAVDYSFIAWPSEGVFPVEFCNSRTPWSITLNPAKYQWSGGYAVTMRRVSDGMLWVFDAADTNASGEFFAANFGGYGVSNAFIFRPHPSTIAYKAGDQFDITLSGGIVSRATGEPVTVQYRTSFGALSGPSTDFGGDATPPTPEPGPAPEPDPAPGTGKTSVYRFYNKKNGSHFYTASASERDTVILNHSQTYAFEGVAYSIDSSNPANCSPLYRFYNRLSGSHFYTASAEEKDMVVTGLSSTFAFEGTAYNVSLTPTPTAMYRFYNNANGSHFYTISAAERDTVIRDLPDRFTYEGVNYYLGN